MGDDRLLAEQGGPAPAPSGPSRPCTHAARARTTPLPRSACSRSRETTSARSDARRRGRSATSTGQPSSDGGRRLPGAASTTSAPRASTPAPGSGRPGCDGCRRRSATLRPSKQADPSDSGSTPERSASTCRMVKQSRRAWVGCSCQPSPALITRARSAHRATWRGAPDDGCRTTSASMPIASTVSTVSRSDSPFLTEEVAMAQRQHVGGEALGGRLEGEPRYAWTPRRTASPRPGPAASAPWGWRGAPPRRRPPLPATPRRSRRARGRRPRAGAGHRSLVLQAPDRDAVVADVDHLVARVGRFLPTKSGRIGSSR